MPRINPEHAKRGAAAEADFKRLLDYSRVPYVYTTQDIESVPKGFREKLKRPDYLCGPAARRKHIYAPTPVKAVP